MNPDDRILETVARTGSMDYSIWPGLLERMLPRLDHIVHNDFPIPSLPLLGPLPPSLINETSSLDPTNQLSSSQSSQKENALPDRTTPIASSPTTPHLPIPDSQPSTLSLPQGSLPPQILSQLTNLQTTIQASFPTYPPHTIQRLAELLLNPTDHYRTLPSYLRALDRVISVSSTANEYPLPTLTTIPATSSSPNNDTLTTSSSAFLSSTSPHEDFNGAALTRIPWLRDPTSPPHTTSSSSDRPPLTGDIRTESTSLIDGPNGAGSLETVTVSVNGVASAGRSDPAMRTTADATASLDSSMADEERVHARGPDEIGMEDMGPQGGRAAGGAGRAFDVEAALGRRGEGEMMIDGHGEGETREAEGSKDADGDVVVADVDGKGEGEEGAGTSVGPDSVDTTAL